jgi:thioredoxin reductase
VLVASADDASNVTAIPAEAAFIAIGHIPNTELLQVSATLTLILWHQTSPYTD